MCARSLRQGTISEITPIPAPPLYGRHEPDRRDYSLCHGGEMRSSDLLRQSCSEITAPVNRLRSQPDLRPHRSPQTRLRDRNRVSENPRQLCLICLQNDQLSTPSPSIDFARRQASLISLCLGPRELSAADRPAPS